MEDKHEYVLLCMLHWNEGRMRKGMLISVGLLHIINNFIIILFIYCPSDWFAPATTKDWKFVTLLDSSGRMGVPYRIGRFISMTYPHYESGIRPSWWILPFRSIVSVSDSSAFKDIRNGRFTLPHTTANFRSKWDKPCVKWLKSYPFHIHLNQI